MPGVHTVRALSPTTLARPATGSTEDQDTILTATEAYAYYQLGHTAAYRLTKRLAPLKFAHGRWRLGDLQRLDAERAETVLGTPLVDAAMGPGDQSVPALPAAVGAEAGGLT
jgi:hypothetical protein